MWPQHDRARGPEHDEAIARLTSLKDDLVAQLRHAGADEQLIDRKVQIERAIAALEWMRDNHIPPGAEVIPVPAGHGFGDYRICFDNDVDDREHWTELLHDNEPLGYALGHDPLIINRSRSH